MKLNRIKNSFNNMFRFATTVENISPRPPSLTVGDSVPHWGSGGTVEEAERREE